MPTMPNFQVMWTNYPRESRPDLYNKIGWSDLIDNSNYDNTCAIRMSICLIRSGLRFQRTSGGERLLKGPHQGALVEIRQDVLSETLVNWWGEPEKHQQVEQEQIKGRQGVISFWEIPGYTVGGGLGGHIDLVRTINQRFLIFSYQTVSCGSGCYWNGARFWFWPAS